MPKKPWKQKPICLAILEVMWDWRAETSIRGYTTAPRLYRINPENFSGKRLYKWVGEEYDLVVTNACKELVTSPNERGTPDPKWLKENVEQAKPNLVLVCGNVAQKTFELANVSMPFRVIYCPHPAYRNWNASALSKMSSITQTKKYERARVSIDAGGVLKAVFSL